MNRNHGLGKINSRIRLCMIISIEPSDIAFQKKDEMNEKTPNNYLDLVEESILLWLILEKNLRISLL